MMMTSHSLQYDDSLLHFEEEVLRHPYAVKTWWHYLDHLGAFQDVVVHKDKSSSKQQDLNTKHAIIITIFERALQKIPYSYKLWRAYLRHRIERVRHEPPGSKGRQLVVYCFERSLTRLHKCPRIWITFLEYLSSPPQQALHQLSSSAGDDGDNSKRKKKKNASLGILTKTRRCFDRALRALPVTQHDRIWPLYLDWARGKHVPTETGLRVYRRYLQFEPTHREECVEYLKGRGRFGEAASVLASCVQDQTFSSLQNKSKHQLWLELCSMITTHPEKMEEVSSSFSMHFSVEAILRKGIKGLQSSSEGGRLWTSLADYYIRKGMFEGARDIYVEGMSTVLTVRDFSLIYDAYAQFLESMISAKMMIENDHSNNQEEVYVDLLLATLEQLVQDRPVLLNATMIRQNPHNVNEWFKRVKLFKDMNQPALVIQTFARAVKAVDATLAVGKYHTLWSAFARFYEDSHNKDLEDAEVIFEQAVKAKYRAPDDLAIVWCEWAEMYIRHEKYQEALQLMRRACSSSSACSSSQRAWLLLGDLTESLGTLEEAKQVYEQMIDLRIVTPQIILNYAALMQEHRFFEESFKIYERGVSLFKFPHSRDIWKTYLAAFVERFKGKKMERTRELFEDALGKVPAEEAAKLYVQYASFEEKYGLAKNVMTIFDRAVRKLPLEEKLSMYELYLKKASDFYGVAKTREVYQQALEVEPPVGLQDKDVKVMCLKFAVLERELGEIDRARAIFRHGAQLADPGRDKAFWDEWNAFEVAHGNEDTFRDMLRIKRSVAAYYSQAYQNMDTVDMKGTGEHENANANTDSMARLEEQAVQSQQAAATAIPGFVKAETINIGTTETGGDGDMKLLNQQVPGGNPENIDIGDDDDEEIDIGDEDASDPPADPPAALVKEDKQDFSLKQKAVPNEVFGSLASRKHDIEEKPVGAMERFKRARNK